MPPAKTRKPSPKPAAKAGKPARKPGGWGRRILRGAAYLAFVGLAAAGLLELAYRYQWIEFYGTELAFQNPDPLPEGKPRVLVLGDSFTASPENYVTQLRRQFPQAGWVNSAVPGTGLVQASLLAPGRIRAYQPSLFIYQIYVGNDLLDYRFPAGGPGLSLARRVYGWLACRMRSLAWVNYKLGQGNAGPDAAKADTATTFSTARYNARERLYLGAEPDLITHSACLRGGREHDWPGYRDRLLDMVRNVPEGTEVWVMVLPHAAQVHPRYRAHLRALDPQADTAALAQASFPLLDSLQASLRSLSSLRVYCPLDSFRMAEAAGTPLFYTLDPHLNTQGQTVLTAWLRPRVQQWLLRQAAP